MKKYFPLILLFVVFMSGYGQEIALVGGVSFHSLSKLKSYQSDINNELVMPMKSTQSFPAHVQLGGVLRFPLKNDAFQMGLQVYSTSSAARSDYADYSGRQRVDFSLRCTGVSYHFNYRIQNFKSSSVSVYVNAGVLFNRLDMDISVTVFDQTDFERNRFTSLNRVGEVGLEYKYFLGKGGLFLLSQAGVHLNQSDSMHDENDNSIPGADWTGLKLLAGIGYGFGKK